MPNKPTPARSAACLTGIAEIRRYYGVPAKRGMIITYGASDGEHIRAKIVGANSITTRLRVRLENNDGTWSRQTAYLHPTWHVTYPSNSQLNEPSA